MSRTLVLVLVAAATVGCGSDQSTGAGSDYTLSIDPASLTLIQGATATTTVSISRTGFAGPVTLSLANAPPGISASFDPPSPTGNNSTLTLNVTAQTPPGDYHPAVTGSANGLNRSAPLSVSVSLNPGPVARVVVGVGYSCFLNPAGQAYCWGGNGSGQLGDGTTTDRLVPTPVSGGLTFASLSGGGAHTCGVTASGAAYCWGDNGVGHLGDGTTFMRLVPTLVSGGLKFAAVSAGVGHTCGVTTAGVGYCWGYNEEGRLGDGTTTTRYVPTLVAGGLSFTRISAGGNYTCGVAASGAAYCWGSNLHGELGTTTSLSYSPLPTQVSGGLTFSSVSASLDHTCGLIANGVAYCWGDNTVGQLGDGTTNSHLAPGPVAGNLTFDRVSSGANGYTCGVTTSGAAYCWGYNLYGQRGDGTTSTSSVPVPIAGGLTFAAVSANLIPDGAHTCGVTTSGAVYCWGQNNSGQLGDGTTTQRLVPTLVVFQ